MNKGQNNSQTLKNLLKVFKMNEDTFSTILGIVVVFLVGTMVVNYFKTTNFNFWKGDIGGAAQDTTMEDSAMDEKINKDTYIVVKGDDLWHISEKFYKSGYNYVDLIKENNLPSSGLIEPGMELRIPKVEAKKMTVKEEVMKKVDQANEVKTIDMDSYVTQKRDSLWTIAVRAYGDGYKWTKIYQENKQLIGNNPNVLFSGLKLVLPKM